MMSIAVLVTYLKRSPDVGISMEDESSSLALHFLNPGYVFVGERIPYGTTVLKMGAHQGEVCFFF